MSRSTHGLKIARPKKHLADENERMRDWFGHDALAWDVPVTDGAALPALAIEREQITSRLLSTDAAPPPRLLQELARLAHAHAAAVTWYSTYCSRVGDQVRKRDTGDA